MSPGAERFAPVSTWWRAAVSSRVVAQGMALTLVLVVAVTAFLVVSRGSQGDQQVRAEAAARSANLGQLVTGVIAPQAQAEVTGLAAASAIRNALGAADPSARSDQLAAVFELGSVTVLPGSRLAIFDSAGTAVYTDECGARVALTFCEAQAGPHLSNTVPSIALALAEGAKAACAAVANRPAPATTPAGCPNGYEGLEMAGPSLPVFDASVPVWDAGNRFLGAVAVSTAVQAAFHRIDQSPADDPALITVGPPAALWRYDRSHNTMQATALPAALAAGVERSAASIDEEYPGAGSATVAGSFQSMAGPDGRVAGYVGVELPANTFAAQTAGDQRAILLIGVSLVVLVFLVLGTAGPRLVPAGPALAATPRSDDARDPIAAASAGESGWTRLVADVEIVQRSIVDAARVVAGNDARVSLFAVVDGELHPAITAAHGGLGALGRGEIRSVLSGHPVRRAKNEPDPPLVLVPALVDGQVRGALAVWSSTELNDAEALALSAVAGSGVSALERMRVS